VAPEISSNRVWSGGGGCSARIIPFSHTQTNKNQKGSRWGNQKKKKKKKKKKKSNQPTEGSPEKKKSIIITGIDGILLFFSFFLSREAVCKSSGATDGFRREIEPRAHLLPKFFDVVDAGARKAAREVRHRGLAVEKEAAVEPVAAALGAVFAKPPRGKVDDRVGAANLVAQPTLHPLVKIGHRRPHSRSVHPSGVAAVEANALVVYVKFDDCGWVRVWVYVRVSSTIDKI
jgi:hypothetical protein